MGRPRKDQSANPFTGADQEPIEEAPKKETSEAPVEEPRKSTETEPIEAKAEDVLIPLPAGIVEFGGEKIEIKPLSLKAALKVGRFISVHLTDVFKSEAYKSAVESAIPKSEAEVFSGVAMELIDKMDEDDIAQVVASIIQKDEDFVKNNLTAAGVLGVIRAFLQTEDFKRIFLELRGLASEIQGKK